MRFYIILIFIAKAALVIYPANAQDSHYRDSLLQELTRAKPDTNKVWLYIKAGQLFESNSPDSALRFYESALQLSNNVGYTRGVISYYTNATYVYNLIGKYDTALSLNLASVEIAKSFGNPERLAACLGNVAASYIQLDQPEKAIEIYLQIIPLFEKLPVTINRAVIYENLCVLYTEVEQPAKAREYGRKALEIFQEFKDDNGIANTLTNLSLAVMNMREYEEASGLLTQARAIGIRTNNQYIVMLTSLNLSNISLNLGKFAEVEKHCQDALVLAKQLNDPISEAIALRGLAIYNFSLNKPSEAERYARQSLQLALQSNSLKHVGKAYGILADIAILRKDFVRNNVYAMKSDSINTLLLNESVVKNVQNIEAKYESEKKEQAIRDLQQAAMIKDLSLERNKLITGVLIGSLGALLAISLLARYSHKQKKALLTQQNQMQEARIAQLEVEKQVLAGEAVIKGQEEERGRLAKDLHDGLGGMLSGVKFSLSNMKSNVVLDADSTLVFERSLDMLDHSITELRRVAHNMMPEVLVQFGLAEAIKSYCESLRAAQIADITFQAVDAQSRLPEKKEIFIFRIVQELLNNVIKHSRASHVLVQFAMHDMEVNVTIEDNGVGFDVNGPKKSVGAGLRSVQSRVDYLKGKLDIQSRPGQGTSVHIIIPKS